MALNDIAFAFGEMSYDQLLQNSACAFSGTPRNIGKGLRYNSLFPKAL